MRIRATARRTQHARDFGLSLSGVKGLRWRLVQLRLGLWWFALSLIVERPCTEPDA